MSAHAGRAAEEIAARHYLSTGAELLEERWRCAEGEIDLVVALGKALVFIEVKQRKRLNTMDSPVSLKQWRRLEAAANQYIVGYTDDTGVQPFCRFDVALIGHDGTVQIIENAWSSRT
ncbi:MAG: YraN family protein [Paracoccaceae bacterium]